MEPFSQYGIPRSQFVAKVIHLRYLQSRAKPTYTYVSTSLHDGNNWNLTIH